MVKCPRCEESYYTEHYSTTTAMYWTPIYKNGVLINENPNTTTTYCTCCNCGNSFYYTNKGETEMSTSLDSGIQRQDASIAEMPVL